MTTLPVAQSDDGAGESAAGGKAASSSQRAGGVHVVTLGDSTIDNLIWMDRDDSTGRFDYEACVVAKLRKHLRELYTKKHHGDAPPSAPQRPPRVVNLAADGFTSDNVLRGAQPVLSRAAWAEHGEPFPAHPSSRVLAPLDVLEEMHARDPVSHVVLSVGGNDVREILRSIHLLPRIVQRLLSNYRAICERVLALTPRPNLVLMMQ